MRESWLGIASSIVILVIAAIAVAGHYRRERRREQLLRNLDHHDWCRWVRVRR